MARARLLCLPHAGSGPSAYLAWNRLLSEDLELQVVAPPGREGRYQEAPVRDASTYLDAVVEALCEIRDLPLFVFGHSMGAVLAYELAQRLSESGQAPRHLFLSARAYPDDLPAASPLFRLSDEALVDEVRTRYGGFPPELEEYPDLFRQALENLRSDLELLETFRPRIVPELAVPMTVFWSEDDASYSREGIQRWRRASRGPVRFRHFPGGHFYLFQRARAVADYVSDVAGSSVEKP